MTPVVAAFNDFAATWARLAWAVAWQSTLLVAAFAIVAQGLRRSAPGLRYGFWQIAAIKLLVMPLWGISILVPLAASGRDTRAGAESSPPAPSVGEIGSPFEGGRRAFDGNADARGLPGPAREGRFGDQPITWQGWLLVGWALALAGQAGSIAHQRELLERLLRQAEPADDPALLALVADLSRRVGLPQPPALLTTDGEGSPFVCGLRRPALVFPRGLAGSLDSESLRSVLVHELAHLKRRDLLWDWIPASARLLYWFHPAAHYIAYRVRLERELACDQAAMVLTGQGAAGYASTLVEVVRWKSAPPALRASFASTPRDGVEPRPTPAATIDRDQPFLA